MSIQSPDIPAHPAGVRHVHERLLGKAGLAGSMVRTADGAAVHVVTGGTGPPVVFIHGSGSPGLLWLPLFTQLDGVRAIVVDRPGFGLSDLVPPDRSPEETAVNWITRLLDALELPSAVLVGHSMGGLWALRFALARPDRVAGLAMLGTPTLPGTCAPLPFRLMGTPGIRTAIARQRETPKSVRQFAALIGEGDTIDTHPGMVDLMVEVGNDPIAGRALAQEVRPLISPWALVSRTGFRRGARVTEAELHGLAVPTLLIWGDHDPVGDDKVARHLHELIPHSELTVVQSGHVPWLGETATVAHSLGEWIQQFDAA